MPYYDIRFIKAATGRSNKARTYAYDEAELRQKLARDGDELVSFETAKETEASEAQLNYLRALGVRIAGPLTSPEASSLIDNAKTRQEPADAEMRATLHALRVEVNRFTSRRDAYHRIRQELVRRGPAELAPWYVYRVYRTNFDRAKGDGIRDWNHPEFIRIAGEIRKDEKLLRSLLNASETSASGFRWFGPFHAPNGDTYYGDSRSTAVHKYTIAALREAGLCPAGHVERVNAPILEKRPVAETRLDLERSSSHASLPPATASRTGCALPVLFAIGTIVGTYWLI
ncbi:MAG TPA: hypothetical protein VGN93_31230 [Shinella sp.]|jgi:hypothetical protein|uniref:hypothetical protein n=1 Tax=Shinella sp. TaxID=1870904 RepID=UPI002E10D8F0|nr:hypothetical protein [Shinella sp.]